MERVPPPPPSRRRNVNARISTISGEGAKDEVVIAPPVASNGTVVVAPPMAQYQRRVAGLSVSNKLAEEDLEEVYVVGYGTQQKRSLKYFASMDSVNFPPNGYYKTKLKERNPTINTQTFKSDKAYMPKLTTTNTEEAYQQYLVLRKDYITTPLFYYDVANWFYQHKDSTKGLLVLSNIADLQLENAAMAANGSAKLSGLCVGIDRWWLLPKSVRYLYSTLTQSYSTEIAGRSNGIEEVVVSELNDLIALHGNHLNTNKINKALIHQMPVDIRVVINWNNNDTDIDLWVTDPNGEKCFYNHNTTEAGGRISQDVTTGYGPEQFMLKKAIKGRYKIQTNYFGDRQINIAGSTAVMAEIYTRYASGLQQRKVIALQMPKDGKDGILIGEFGF